MNVTEIQSALDCMLKACGSFQNVDVEYSFQMFKDIYDAEQNQVIYISEALLALLTGEDTFCAIFDHLTACKSVPHTGLVGTILSIPVYTDAVQMPSFRMNRSVMYVFNKDPELDLRITIVPQEKL